MIGCPYTGFDYTIFPCRVFVVCLFECSCGVGVAVVLVLLWCWCCCGVGVAVV